MPLPRKILTLSQASLLLRDQFGSLWWMAGRCRVTQHRLPTLEVMTRKSASGRIKWLFTMVGTWPNNIGVCPARDQLHLELFDVYNTLKLHCSGSENSTFMFHKSCAWRHRVAKFQDSVQVFFIPRLRRRLSRRNFKFPLWYQHHSWFFTRPSTAHRNSAFSIFSLNWEYLPWFEPTYFHQVSGLVCSAVGYSSIMKRPHTRLYPWTAWAVPVQSW